MKTIVLQLTPKPESQLETIRKWLTEDSGGIVVTETRAVELLISGHHEALNEERANATAKHDQEARTPPLVMRERGVQTLLL